MAISYDLSSVDPDESLNRPNSPSTYDWLLAELKRRNWPTFSAGTGQVKTFCPICEGDESNSPSLSIGRGRNGRALFICYKNSSCGLGQGCTRTRPMVTKLLQAFQVAAVPERAAARHRKRNQRGQDPCKAGAEVVARYDYGNGRFKVRYAWQDDNGVWAKDFRWVNKGGAGVLLYRPPTRCELRTSAVFIVEGEKDVDRLRDAGFVATCTSEGSLTPDLARKFAGAKAVAVLRDYDEHGERVRTKATAALEAVGVFAFPVDLPGLKETANRGKDVSDWLDAGGTARRLKSLVIEAAR